MLAMTDGIEVSNDVCSCGVKAWFQHACAYKNKFKQSSCALGISVGQLAHEGDKFAATINMVNNSFRECIILVGDSLYRHNMSLNAKKSFVEVHQEANILGEQWIARNKKIINKLTIPHQIIRWDYWLHHPLFADAQAKVNRLHECDSYFKKALYGAAEDFAKRTQKRFIDSHFDYNKVFKASILFIKEECAAMLLWITEDIDFEVYPGSRVQVMEYVHTKLIVPKYGKTLLPLSIRFKKKRSVEG